MLKVSLLKQFFFWIALYFIPFKASGALSIENCLLSPKYNRTNIADIVAFLKIKNEISNNNAKQLLISLSNFQATYPSSVLNSEIPTLSLWASYKSGGSNTSQRVANFTNSWQLEKIPFLLEKLVKENEVTDVWGIVTNKRLFQYLPKKLPTTIPFLKTTSVSNFNQSFSSLLQSTTLFNQEWGSIFYNSGQYEAVTLLLTNIKKLSLENKYYLGASYYNLGNYVAAENTLQLFRSPGSTFKDELTRWGNYYYCYALIRNKKLTLANSLLANKLEILNEREWNLFLQANRGTKDYTNYVNLFIKRFPSSWRTYSLKRGLILSSLKQLLNSTNFNQTNGEPPAVSAQIERNEILKDLKKLYSFRPADYEFIEDYVFSDWDNGYLENRSTGNDYFYKKKITKSRVELIAKSNASSYVITNILKKNRAMSLYDSQFLTEGHKSNYVLETDSPLSFYLTNFLRQSIEKNTIPPLLKHRLQILAALRWDYTADKEIAKANLSKTEKLVTELSYLTWRGEETKKIRKIISFLNEVKLPDIVLPKEILKALYPTEALPYWQQILHYSKREKISPLLCAAVIRGESFYLESAKSPSGAMGLMQVMHQTGREIYKNSYFKNYLEFDLFNPELNIALGTRFLSDLTKRFEHLSFAIAAYNGGPGNMRKWEREYDGDEIKFSIFCPIDETERYVRKVLSAYHMYKYVWPEFEPKG